MCRKLVLLPCFAVLLALPYITLAQSSARAAASVLQPPFGEKLQLPGLPNAGKISDVLYRGAQPHAEGFLQLKKIGITTIVDLRAEDSAKRTWERQQAEALGMRFLSIPIGGWSPPTDEQVLQFLALFGERSNGKVFVHCHYGEDRTGVLVAIYRVTYDSWPAARAIQEMNFFGFHGFWHPAMKNFVRDFPARMKNTPALAGFSGTQPNTGANPR